MQTAAPTCLPAYFALTLAYVHTDPDGLPSFADKRSFGIGHRIRIHTTKETAAHSGQPMLSTRTGSAL